MTKQKSTKRALLMSGLALIVCVSMLIGSTFAWFTDSVTSAGNIIKSGKLDVTMEWMDATANGKVKTYTDASAGPIFNYDLWEPGYVEAKNIKISNIGTLALKYQLNIVASGKVSQLADVIDVYYAEGKKTLANRDAMSELKLVGTLNQVLAGMPMNASGELEANKEREVTIALKMQESAGNEYQGLAIGSEFAVQLLATQLTSEFDSFNNQYDENATFIPAWDGSVVDSLKPDAKGVYHITNASELAYVGTLAGTLAAEGEAIKVVLDADINLGNLDWTPIGSENKPFCGTFNGQGHTIYNVNITKSGNVGEPGDSGFFGVIKNKGTKIENINLVNVSVSVENGERLGALVGKSLFGDISNCSVTNATVLGHSKVSAIVGDCYGANVTGCTVSGAFLAATEKAAATVVGRANASEGGTVTIKNNVVNDCTVICPKQIDYILGTSTYSKPIDLSTNKYSNVELVTGSATMIATADDLVALGGTKINGNYYLTADIDMDGKVMKSMEVSGGAVVNFVGNGHTISNLELGAANIHGMTGAGNEVAGLFDLSAPATTVSLTVDNLNIEKATVNCSGYAAAIVGYNPNGGTVINLNNVDVEGATITAESVAALVGYTTGKVNLSNCDINGLSLTGETGRPEKVGAYIGTANTESCVVTVSNCTNNTAYPDFGRVINGATWNGKAYTFVSDGLYTDSNGNYLVFNAAGLQSLKTWMDSHFNNAFWGKTYNIMNDIDATNVEWNTKFISPDSTTFNGITFNGNGHTISNLTINGQGLFSGATKGGTSNVPSVFKDVVFDNVTVNGGTHHNGVIWGEAYGDITVDGVEVINSKISGGCNVGALIGRNGEGSSTIKFVDCAVKNTKVEATQVADYAGASAFIGMAIEIGDARSINLIFEGNNVSEGNTLTTGAGMQGGGIYTAVVYATNWENPTVVNDFSNFSGTN